MSLAQAAPYGLDLAVLIPMASLVEKGGGSFKGIKLLLCENPLPPLDVAIQAATEELPHSNYYTEPYSEPLRKVLSDRLGVSVETIHINAGSELILRQIFDRLGKSVHLLTPTYSLFPEIATHYTETQLTPENSFAYDLGKLRIPLGTSLVVIVNPNNPNGGVFDIDSLPELLNKYPDTYFLVDEAFIGFAGNTAIPMIHRHSNLIVTRTFSKAHSLAGFRIGYAVLPKRLADDLNTHNDAYPLARPSQAAALATLLHEDEIKLRITELRKWTEDLRACLNRLGVRTFPTQTYFFLADFSPFDAEILAAHLHEYQILVKPLNLPRLGKGFMRITTALPEDNKRFLNVLERILNAKR